MAMDKIIIDGIEFYGYHGDLPEERELGQIYKVDLELMLSTVNAGRTDRIEETIDYAAVVRRVHEIGRTEQYNLIETLAEELAGTILKEFSPHEIRIRVSKPHPPIPLPLGNVSVEILRSRP
jgi:dihydroneopterin aldolase